MALISQQFVNGRIFYCLFKTDMSYSYLYIFFSCGRSAKHTLFPIQNLNLIKSYKNINFYEEAFCLGRGDTLKKKCK